MADNRITVDTSASPTALTFSPRFNVAAAFIDRHLEEGRAGKVAIHHAGEPVTYGMLADGVNRCGNALLNAGMAPGERLLMMVKDSPEFFYLFWGAIKAGIIPVPVNTMLRAADYAYMIGDSACTGLACSAEFAGEVEAALDDASPVPGTVIRVEGEGQALHDSLAFGDLMKDAAGLLDPAPATADDDCFWLYSSGTTGKPKGAVHKHRDMVVASQYYGVETLGCGEDDVCYSAAKLFFAYGLGNAMTFPLWVGASTVLFAPRPTPDTTFEVMQTHRPTLYFGVPTLYAAQLQAMEKDMPDLSFLRCCVSAGEALPADLLHRWKEKTGTDILDGIGSTEALHIFISNRAGDIKPGASGREVTGYEARIVDGGGNDVPTGESGQLIIRGRSCAERYWNNAQRTAATMVDGWLNTGDTYYRDEDGYYFYCGRNDDMMKVGGIWCSPFEIEAKLVEHDSVLEAAVVGRADDAGLVKPQAHVVPAEGIEGSDALADELLNHCKDGLAPYKYPRWFVFTDALPKTATGKIQRFKLRS